MIPVGENAQRFGQSGQARVWPGAIVWACVFLIAALLSIRKVWEADFWWQLATGHWVMQHWVPRKDPFSFTNPGHERLELRWLYCVWLHLTVTYLGVGTAILTKTLAVLATLWASVRAGPARLGSVWHAVVAGLCVFAASQRFMLRPETLSYLFVAVFVLGIERLRSRPHDGRHRSAWIATLTGVQLVWTNCHGLFALGPAIVGAWLTGELIDGFLRRPLTGTGDATDPARPQIVPQRPLRAAAYLLIAVSLACLVNPYFIKGIWLPVQQFLVLHGGSQKTFFAEFVSPFDLPPGSPPAATLGDKLSRLVPSSDDHNAIFAYKLLLGLLGVTALFNLRRLSAYHWLLLLSQAYLTFTGVRNVPLLAVVTPLIVFTYSRRPEPPNLPVRAGAGGFASLASLALLCTTIWFSWRIVTDRYNLEQGDSTEFGLGISTFRFPIEATRTLAEAGVEGPIFNSPLAGSYLLSQGYKVFIDPRGEVYQDSIIDEYRGLVEHPDRLDEYTDRYGLRAMVLETQNYSLAPLIRAAGGSSHWRLVPLDPVAAVLVHAASASKLPAVSLESSAWMDQTLAPLPPVRSWSITSKWEKPSDPAPYLVLARACANLGAFRAARTLYEDCLVISEAGFPDYDNLSRLATLTGDWSAAADYAARPFELAGAPPPGQTPAARADSALRAAGLLLKAGDGRRALPIARVAVRHLHDEPDAQLALGLAALAAESNEEALGALRLADIRRPHSPSILGPLGRAQLRNGKHAEALASLEAAMNAGVSDPGVMLDAAEAAQKLGYLDKARGWVQQVRERSPSDARLPALIKALGIE